MNFSDKRLTPELQANRAAYTAFKDQRSIEADIKIKAYSDAVIGQDADITTHLAFCVMALSKLVNPSMVPVELLPNQEMATAMLTGYAQAMLMIQQERAARDSDIAAFVLPYPAVGI